MQIVSPTPARRVLSVILFAACTAIGAAACASQADCRDGQTRCNADGTIGTCNAYANCGDSGFDCDTVWESSACPARWSCQTAADLSGDSTSICLPTNLVSGCASVPIESALLDPTGVAVADVNGDTKLDIVAVGGSTAVFFGHGDGSFEAGPTSSPDWNAVDLAAADFDGDGHVDLLGLGTNDDGSLVLQESNGDGAGNFAAPFSRVGSPAIGTFHGPPLAGDVNEDGKADAIQDDTLLLAGASATTIAWPAACDANATARALVDLDGDAHLDLVALGDAGACVIYGDGKGNFANGALVAAGAFAGSALQIADFDGDGRVDLGIAPPSTASGLTFAFDRGARAFDVALLPPSSTSPFAGAFAADLDGDGRADWMAGGASFVTIWLSGTNGQPNEPVYYALKTTGENFDIAALAHLHGGNQVDAVIVSENVSVVANACR